MKKKRRQQSWFYQFLCLGALLFCSQFALAQNITGTVTDTEGEPLIGVNILVEDAQGRGTVTDFNGDFELAVDQGAILIFSYTGHTDQKVTVGAATNLAIILQENVEVLDEVVVIGYGVAKKSDITGSVATVDVDELKKIGSLDVTRNLQGKVAGVQVTSNAGAPGSGTSIRIRGVGSFQNANPLYVVDGFLTDDISNIGPNDIASVEVLKDASATAIYGSRGSNGVVLITTQKGKTGETVIELNSFAGFQAPWNKLDMLNANQYAELYLEAVSGYEDNLNSIRSASNRAWIVDALGFDALGTNWQDLVFRNDASIQSHSLNIRGAEGRMKYVVGGTFFDQNGIVLNTGSQRIQGNFGLEFEAKSWLTIGADLKYSNNTFTPFDNGAFTTPLASALSKDPVGNIYDNITGNWDRTGLTDKSNPARLIYNQQFNENVFDRYLTSINAKIKLLPNLVLNTSISLDQRRGSRSQYNPTYTTVSSKALGEDFLPTVASNETNLVSSLRENEEFTWVMQNSNFLNYTQELGKGSFGAMVGLESYQNRYSFNSVFAQGVPEPEEQRYINLAADAASVTASDFENRFSLLSYFGRLNYSYDNRYMFTATIRRDGSSKFARNNRWGTFPSFAAGWNVHNESFFKQGNILSRLKVRAGWGQVGNQNPIGSYDYVALLSSNFLYALDNTQPAQGLATVSLPSADLKWEVSEMANIGLDFGFFEDQLSVTVEYFDKNTKDLLVQSIPTPNFTGARGPASNAASMTNKGFEVSAEYRNKIGKLGFSIGGNISAIDNEVTSLGAGDLINGGFQNQKIGYAATSTIVGDEFASFYGLLSAGIYQTQDEVNRNVGLNAAGNPINVQGIELTDIEPTDSRGRIYGFYTDENGERKRAQVVQLQRNAKPGDVIYQDINKDGKINEKDLVRLGSAIPNFTYGGYLNVDYGIFDLSLSFAGSQGNEIANITKFFIESSNPLESNLTTNRFDRWTPTNPSQTEPRITTANNDNSLFSDRYIEDGSFFRLRNIQLGMTLPSSLTDRINFEKVRLYISGDNLFTKTNYSGLDPEIGITTGDPFGSGVDYGTYPIARSFLVGTNITF